MRHNKNYSQKDFYMERKGPWPQPSPVHPWGESPAVLKLPFCETLDWWIWIGSRYVATLLLVSMKRSLSSWPSGRYNRGPQE